jgi:uncharacterized protein (DUF2236 family)
VVGGRPEAERPLTGPDDARDLAADAESTAAAEAAAAVERDGLYGPGSEAWRLNREATLLLGAGPRALLMQLAHPLVAEGVDQHSDFRIDPWARLSGTIRSYLRIVYGTGSQARAEIRRLNGLHRDIQGPVRDARAADRFGPAYAARDPDLSLWVHATLVDSTLVTARRWLGAMPAEQRTRAYEETLPVGRLFGVPERALPATIEAFDAYVAGMLGPDGPVHPTATARDLAQAILHPPLDPLAAEGPVADWLGRSGEAVTVALELLPPVVYDWLLVPAVGLLPARMRAEYGLAWGTRERAIDAWLTTAWGGWRRVLPTSWRWFPQAIAADRRVGPGR